MAQVLVHRLMYNGRRKAWRSKGLGDGAEVVPSAARSGQRALPWEAKAICH